MSSQRSGDEVETPERKMSMPTVFSLEDEDENSWWGTGSSTPTRAPREQGEGICEQLHTERKALSVILAADMDRWIQQRRLEVEAEKNSLVEAVRTELAEHLTQVIESCISKKLATSGSEIQLLSQNVEALRHQIEDTPVQRRRYARCASTEANAKTIQEHLEDSAQRLSTLRTAAPTEPTMCGDFRPASVDTTGGGVAEDAWAEMVKLRQQLTATEESKRTARVEADYALNNLEACQSQLARSRDEVRKLEACIDELRVWQPKTEDAGQGGTKIDHSRPQHVTAAIVPAATQRRLADLAFCTVSFPPSTGVTPVTRAGEPEIAS